MKTMKPASEWCEEMFGSGNWVVADEITIKAIQEDAFRYAAETMAMRDRSGEDLNDFYKKCLSDEHYSAAQ